MPACRIARSRIDDSVEYGVIVGGMLAALLIRSLGLAR